MERNDARPSVMRELFIEELAEVRGGADPLQKVKDTLMDLRDLLLTTYGCGEELIDVC
jgi:hypothetical protein